MYWEWTIDGPPLRAFRKGKNYGTILVDLEKKCVIDLLPDRESQTLKQWLDEHPGVEVISRDRAGAYALAATQGAPQAVQPGRRRGGRPVAFIEEYGRSHAACAGNTAVGHETGIGLSGSGWYPATYPTG